MKKILIIEDERPLLDALKKKLLLEGFSVLEATNGEVGLSKAVTEHPDLILLDILMPKMNGMAMIKKLRNDLWGANVPVIVLTNVESPEEAIDALEFETLENKPLNYFKNDKSRNIKEYLNARLLRGVDDYIVKSNCTLANVIQKVEGYLS